MIKDRRFRPKTTLDNCILSLCYSSSVSVLLVWPGLTVLISQVPLLLPSPNKGKGPPWKQAADNLTVSGACAQACLAPLSSSSLPFRLVSPLGVFSHPLTVAHLLSPTWTFSLLVQPCLRLFDFSALACSGSKMTLRTLPIASCPWETLHLSDPGLKDWLGPFWSQCPAGSKFTGHTRTSELPVVCILLGHLST